MHTYILDEARSRRLIGEMASGCSDGIWLIDVDPRAEVMLVGPFRSITEAHDGRDYIWAYQRDFGRYLWYVSPRCFESIRKLIKHMRSRDVGDRPCIELSVDDRALEVVNVRFVGTFTVGI